ncbi:MAG: family N-acetyltransferase [Sphingomonas bacterium]|uniref:GNAT family N-acetyltransferase n=1 Tax=Sphingomonas bacterium TaxID=1895847 RepID=UPI002618806C|nr:GNAT family N-acetyltransferase [Sphingomonas bacterium]MDB5706425.1 family N-acetyltransferase [Sphingomonas bacterium]
MNAWRDAPTLIGKHLTLRPLSLDDRAGLLAAMADGDLAQLFYTVVPTPETVDAWFAKLFAERDAGRAMPFAVIAADGRIAGTTRFMRMSEADKRVEIGGTLYAKSVQRTGLNTEAKRMLLAHAFDAMGVHCVQIRTGWHNRTSRQAIERLGAKLDGVLRNHKLMPDGHFRDTMVYSIITEEWPGVRANLDWLMAQHEESRG